MTGTLPEILTVRSALVRALLSAERHLASANTKALRQVYEKDVRAASAALRILDTSATALAPEQREQMAAFVEQGWAKAAAAEAAALAGGGR